MSNTGNNRLDTPHNGNGNGNGNGTTMENPRHRPPLHSQPLTVEKKGSSGWFYAVVFIVVFGSIVGYIFWRHSQAETELKKNTEEMAIPSVTVVHPVSQAAEVKFALPGNVQAYIESTIYARVSGYLKKWYVDIGATVKEGQLLAEIDTPETDQQLNQFRATLTQNQADLQLAQSTADRWTRLIKDNAVSQQEVDEKLSALNVAKANVAAAAANVKRLEDLQAFQKVYAPYDGVITARRTDVGNLINAGAGSPSQQLFGIAQINILRVYVSVPEIYATYVTPGLTAQVELGTNPGAPITGKLVRTSGSIDPTSHTMLAEIDLDNPDGKLLPGGYAQAHFDITMDHPPLVIPANALIFRSKGAQVAVVDPATNTAHLTDIKIGRDFGTKLEITQGLNPSDQIIVNPADSLSDGSKVQVESKP